MWRPLWIPWRWWRRVAQLALLLVFVWLFRRTEYSSGADQLAGGENALFRLDPLVGIAAMLGARQLIVSFWPALILVLLTMLLGRFFCGWVCPLGTLLDYFHHVVLAIRSPLSLWERVRVRAGRTKKVDASSLPTAALTPGPSPKGRGRMATSGSGRMPLLRATQYFLLICVLLAAVFAFPLVGYVDPFSLLVRGMTFWADPLLYRGVDACFGWAGDGWAVNVLQPFVKKHLLSFQPMVFHLAGVSAALLAAIFALEFVTRRFWCRYLCPAGALLGLLGRRSLVKQIPAKVCKPCGKCTTICRMNALDPTSGLSPEACTLCMDCVDYCPKRIARFGIARKTSKLAPRPVDLSRRTVLAGLVAGAAIPTAALAARLGYQSPPAPNLLRPPGGDDERTFLNLCVRCGECLKVCPTNVLQPTIFEAGLEGVFSPRLVPRLIFQQSYCEYTCTLCGQVCPTGAIPRLTEELKHAHPTGKAYFDHSLCLPWAEKTPCIRCEEMCPAPDKAIKILNTLKIKDKDGQEVEIQQPYVDRDLCVGCGICESNCTIEGVSAVRVRRVDAPDPGTEFLLKSAPATPQPRQDEKPA
jgi:polyferredoxin